MELNLHALAGILLCLLLIIVPSLRFRLIFELKIIRSWFVLTYAQIKRKFND